MSRWNRARVWLPIPLLVSATLAPACGPEFSSCEAHRSCPPAETGGGSGSGGSGSGGSGSGGRVDSAGQPASGNAAGFDAGGSSAAGAGGVAGVAGTSGGGEGGGNETCSDEGAVECASAASPFVRTCTSGLWTARSCEDGALCDSSDATCKPVIEGCLGRDAGDAFCEGVDKRRVCGPDLVTTTDLVCGGACLDGACRKPSCGDGKLEKGESCDDGNLAAGDGCSSSCRAEPIAIELGDSFACALLSDQRLKCWGANGSGELGLGDVLARGDAPGELGPNLKETLGGVTAFAVGRRHACAVSNSETWCWGDNSKYALGTASLSPLFSRVPVKVAVGQKPRALAAGADFTCALIEGDDSLRCWGSNTGEVFGISPTYLPTGPQVALPHIVLGSHPTSVSAGLSLCVSAASGLVCSGPRFPSAAFRLDLGGDFSLAGVSSGASHDCAWSTTGDVKCWGAEAGTLGLDGQVSSANDAASAPVLALDAAASALDVGFDSTCAILAEGSVECWGAAQMGALGRPDLGASVGATSYLGDEADEMAELQPLDLGADGLAKAISVGRGFACALLQRGAIKCWGDNASGQLGHGDTEISGDDPDEMGDALAETELD
jgi:cysteine-rich repeat protein